MSIKNKTVRLILLLRLNRFLKAISFCLVGYFCLVGCNTSSPPTNETSPPPLENQSSIIDNQIPEMADSDKIKMDSSIVTTHLMGKFDPLKDKNFIEIELEYADRPGQILHKETYAAFLKMFEAAKKDSIKLIIKSATRNFSAQKAIWEGKWNGKRLLEGNINAAQKIPNPKQRALKILEYSSMPGTSRHHWGTDIDLNAFVNSYFEKGEGKKEYDWLVANAGTFGFCQPYTPKGSKRPEGYNEEKWHWSYLPLATRLSDQYKIRLNDKDISGFDGAETATEIGIIKKYVFGINHHCL